MSEKEQRPLKVAISEMEEGMTAQTDKTEELEGLIEKVKQMAQSPLLTAKRVHEISRRWSVLRKGRHSNDGPFHYPNRCSSRILRPIAISTSPPKNSARAR